MRSDPTRVRLEHCRIRRHRPSCRDVVVPVFVDPQYRDIVKGSMDRMGFDSTESVSFSVFAGFWRESLSIRWGARSWLEAFLVPIAPAEWRRAKASEDARWLSGYSTSAGRRFSIPLFSPIPAEPRVGRRKSADPSHSSKRGRPSRVSRRTGVPIHRINGWTRGEGPRSGDDM